MLSTQTICKTCGVEYKASYLFPLLVILILIAAIIGGSWWYYKQQELEKENIRKANVASYVEILKKIDIPENEANMIATLKFSDISSLDKKDFSTLRAQVLAFEDQLKLSNSVMRVALAQPISELQKIKREVDKEKYIGCLEASRLLYSSSMDSSIEGMLTFLSEGKEKHDQITYLFTRSIVQGKEAKKLINECESRISN